MSRSKQALLAAGALAIVFGIGYTIGASGRFAVQNAFDEQRLHLHLAEAQVRLLEGRVALFNVNFGEASRHFEEAQTPLRAALDRVQQIGNTAAAGDIAAALTHADEARRLAGKLDQAANGKAAEALDAIRAASTR